MTESEELEEFLKTHFRKIKMRERDILEVLTEQETHVWVKWAIGGWSHERLARRERLAVHEVQTVLSKARTKLEKRIREVQR